MRGTDRRVAYDHTKKGEIVCSAGRSFRWIEIVTSRGKTSNGLEPAIRNKENTTLLTGLMGVKSSIT